MKILITGGSEGIGLGLATRFLDMGHAVLVTGRTPEKLQKAAAAHPGLQTYVNDLADPGEREKLAAYVREVMPGLNVLVNNAGIQRRVSLAEDQGDWADSQTEIDLLFSGPVHLNRLLIPLILQQGEPGMIVNVTSGGAYIPQVFAPVYSACKAALHSYTMVLRHALAATPCRVVELVPPAVQTGLAGPGMHHGASLDLFCDTVFPNLFKDDVVGFGPTENITQELAGKPLADVFQTSSTRFPVKIY